MNDRKHIFKIFLVFTVFYATLANAAIFPTPSDDLLAHHNANSPYRTILRLNVKNEPEEQLKQTKKLDLIISADGVVDDGDWDGKGKNTKTEASVMKEAKTDKEAETAKEVEADKEAVTEAETAKNVRKGGKGESSHEEAEIIVPAGIGVDSEITEAPIRKSTRCSTNEPITIDPNYIPSSEEQVQITASGDDRDGQFSLNTKLGYKVPKVYNAPRKVKEPEQFIDDI